MSRIDYASPFAGFLVDKHYNNIVKWLQNNKPSKYQLNYIRMRWKLGLDWSVQKFLRCYERMQRSRKRRRGYAEYPRVTQTQSLKAPPLK